MRRTGDWAATAALISTTVYFVVWVIRSSRVDGLVAFDIYNYYLPNMLYALRSLHSGGSGFLWNALQDCGQPFFGTSSTGIFYPGNALFLLFHPDNALRGVISINFLVAGVTMYGLCRELGASPIAALGGALAFQWSNATIQISMWGPQMSGTYVWMPASLLFCERILRQPTFRNAVGLAVALSLALLPGFFQIGFLTYQLIALRVLWEFASRRGAVRINVVATLAIALALPPLLTAVHFFPGLETALLSLRSAHLTTQEMAPSGFLTIEKFRSFLSLRRASQAPFILLPCLLAAAAWIRPASRRRCVFYGGAAIVYSILAFGPNTPLFALYTRLPLGTLFREPQRLLWIPNFCIPILAAVAIDGLASLRSYASWQRWAAVALAACTVVGFALLVNDWLNWVERAAAGTAIAALIWATVGRPPPQLIRTILLSAVAANLFYTHSTTLIRLLASSDELYRNRSTFEDLKARMTPNDRVYVAMPNISFALEPKTVALFNVPSIYDYEPQPTRRFAEFFMSLRTGRELKIINDWYLPLEGMMPPGFNRPLLNLTAARYLIVEKSIDHTNERLKPPLPVINSMPSHTVYENGEALPRAFYVPRIEVVPDPSQLLVRLKSGEEDLRQVAFVEHPPVSGSTGVPGNIEPGDVQFIRNDPEDVILRVRAQHPGFLFLADQYFPGWNVSVNGAATEIMRANHSFRLVAVPAGESLVTFAYRPLSFRLGVIVSSLTILVVVVLLIRSTGTAGATLPEQSAS